MIQPDTQRDRWIWRAYFFCMLVFLVSAPVFGPFALAVGVLATVLGAERAVTLRRRGRHIVATLVALMVIGGVASIILPIWGHSGFRFSETTGELEIKKHDHYLWETGHIH